MSAVGDEKPPFPRCFLNFLVRRLRKSDCSLGHLEAPLTCKEMAEAIWDGDNRRMEGLSQMGCTLIEMHPAEPTGATKNHPTNPTTYRVHAEPGRWT
jgi:hypothetical protein